MANPIRALVDFMKLYPECSRGLDGPNSTNQKLDILTDAVTKANGQARSILQRHEKIPKLKDIKRRTGS